MSVRTEVLLWAQRVLARKGAPPHQLLEVAETATAEEAQAAFHRIARMAHPDLHRSALEPAELDQVTVAYARIAAAYQELRSRHMQTVRMKTIADPGAPPKSVTQDLGPPDPPPPSSTPAGAMSSKALLYYRKAELNLRRGDLRAAVLQLKLAIAADPQSAFLRSALAEVEAEIGK